MLNTLANSEDRVTTTHRAKLAYIYVRQSTAGQVRQHQESTELQYRLVDRAALFGCTVPTEAVCAPTRAARHDSPMTRDPHPGRSPLAAPSAVDRQRARCSPGLLDARMQAGSVQSTGRKVDCGDRLW